MRSLRLCSEWPQTHPDFIIKQYRYEVPEGLHYDMYWNDVRKKFSDTPQTTAIMGIKCDFDLTFMEDIDWSFVELFNTSVPHASAFAFIYAYERFKKLKTKL